MEKAVRRRRGLDIAKKEYVLGGGDRGWGTQFVWEDRLAGEFLTRGVQVLNGIFGAA